MFTASEPSTAARHCHVPAVDGPADGMARHGVSDFFAPRMFIAARQTCRAINAKACALHPHTIHSALLDKNTQKPTLRRALTSDATSHEASTVTAIAGHWIQSTVMKEDRRICSPRVDAAGGIAVHYQPGGVMRSRTARFFVEAHIVLPVQRHGLGIAGPVIGDRQGAVHSFTAGHAADVAASQLVDRRRTK